MSAAACVARWFFRFSRRARLMEYLAAAAGGEGIGGPRAHCTDSQLTKGCELLTKGCELWNIVKLAALSKNSDRKKWKEKCNYLNAGLLSG